MNTIVVMLCRIGTRLCALPLTHVVETMEPLPVRPVPGMPDVVAGLSLVRGVPLPVVDAAALIGENGNGHGRFVTLEVHDRQLILAVSDVVEIRAMEAGPFRAMSTLLGAARGEADLGALDLEVLWLLDAARMMPQSDLRAATLDEATV